MDDLWKEKKKEDKTEKKGRMKKKKEKTEKAAISVFSFMFQWISTS